MSKQITKKALASTVLTCVIAMKTIDQLVGPEIDRDVLNDKVLDSVLKELKEKLPEETQQ